MRQTRRHYATTVALAIAVALCSVSVSAEMYKWVDERGVTTYSDKKPDDVKGPDKVKTVGGNLSVYSPDKSLLQAVEVARVRAAQAPRPTPEVYRAQPYYAAPMSPQPPVEADPCAYYGDCGGYYYPAAAYPYRRRAPFVAQTVLPPNAQPGLIANPGIIPGNSATTQFNTPAKTSSQRVAPHPRVQPVGSSAR